MGMAQQNSLNSNVLVINIIVSILLKFMWGEFIAIALELSDADYQMLFFFLCQENDVYLRLTNIQLLYSI